MQSVPHEEIIDDLEGHHPDLWHVEVNHLEDDQDVALGRVQGPDAAGAHGLHGSLADLEVDAAQRRRDELFQKGLRDNNLN